MPCAEASRRCPQAIFVKPQFSNYQAVSKQVHEVFRQFTTLIEPLSLDEAYLDVSSSTLFNGSAVLLAQEIRSTILANTGLVASAGVSYNKFLAKIASDHDKPDGLFCITPEQGEDFVAALPVCKFHGVGAVTQARMSDLGIHTGADLKCWSLPDLEQQFGKSARYFYYAARGIDHRVVSSSRQRRSMGSEQTFADNLRDKEQMLEQLLCMGIKLLESLTERHLCASTINIKVRFGDFETRTRAYSLTQGVVDEVLLRRVLPYLLDRALGHSGKRFSKSENPDRNSGVRLLGVSLSTLTEQGDNVPTQLEIDI
jgi:DNA polymerase-4